jgi:anti-sigma factor RsiW
MMKKTHFLNVLPAYVLGCLEEGDRLEMEEHLANCSVCQLELKAYRELMALLALAARQKNPPPQIKINILEQVQ